MSTECPFGRGHVGNEQRTVVGFLGKGGWLLVEPLPAYGLPLVALPPPLVAPPRGMNWCGRNDPLPLGAKLGRGVVKAEGPPRWMMG